MKACNHPDYENACPEQFNWNLLESYKLEEVAVSIARAAQIDLKSSNRNYLPGLRVSLQHIASVADV